MASMLVRTSLPDQVFHRLVSDVLAGRYAPGERLPTQRALAAELGVNMASVREGVKRLEQLGLVEVRHGDAMRVLDWRLHGGPDVLVHLIARAGSLDVEMVRSVMEARRLLLAESGRLAAGRRSKEQAELLASLADQLAAADGDAAQHLDFAFFAALIEAAGNVVFLLVMNSIRALYLENLELFRPLVSAADPYTGAARAVREGDGDAARRDRRPARGRAGAAAAGGAVVKVLSPREAAIFAAFTDAVAMPEPPSPPVGATDAIEGFDAWLADAPQANRTAIRASLLGLGTRLRGRDRAERADALRALAHTPGVAPLMEALRAAAAAAYYGDDGVMQRLGYDAGERVRRGAEIRAAAPPEPTGGIVDLSRLRRPPHRARRRRRHRLRRRRRRGGQGARRGGRAGRPARGGRAARRGGLHRAPARHAPAPLPRRCPARDARAPADPAAARPRGRRHHAGQLRHVLPHARPRARPLA